MAPPFDLWLYVAMAAILLVPLAIVWLWMGDVLVSDLRAAGRRLGVRWWDAAPVAIVGGSGFVSTFALGGETTGRGDLDFALAGAVYVVGLVGLALAVGNLDEFRLVGRTPTTDAVAVEPGTVEVAGEALPADRTRRTPFCDREALCFRWRVEEHRDYGRRSAWTTVGFDDGGVPFFVDDGTGRVCVDPAGGDLRLGEERTVSVDGDEALPDGVREFVEGRPDLAGGGTDRRFVESHVAPGDAVLALGEASRSFSGEYPDDTVIGAGDDGVLLAAGTPESVTRDLRRLVVYGGGGGLVATVVGYLSMLFVSGAV